MFNMKIGPRLVAVLDLLNSIGRATTAQLAQAMDVSVRKASKLLRKWMDWGWVERVRPGLYSAGWKAFGKRVEPSPMSDEWNVLMSARANGNVTIETAARLVAARNYYAASVVIDRLVRTKWLKQSPGSLVAYVVAPDPFASAEIIHRVNTSIDRLRAGELIMKRQIDA